VGWDDFSHCQFKKQKGSVARQEKGVYVPRDGAGQRVKKEQLVSLVVTSRGLFCSEAHDLLRFWYRHNPLATTALYFLSL
jgi:hypothetical protein